MVLDGPINGLAFQAYVDQVLVPELKPGDVVVMDNLGSHKGASVRSSIEAAGARLLYLPPTVPTSIRSRSPSPNSRPSCARPPSEPSRACGPGSENAFPPSAQTNAKTTSPPQAMMQREWIRSSLTDAGIEAARTCRASSTTPRRCHLRWAAEMKQFCVVMGELNFVGICEVPDDIAIARYDRPKGAQINGPPPSRTRPWSSPSEGIRCCRSTIAFALSSRRSRIRRCPHRCNRRLQLHGIAGCPRLKAKASPKRKFLRLTRSAIPYRHRRVFEPRRAGSISLSRLIGPRSSSSSNCMRR